MAAGWTKLAREAAQARAPRDFWIPAYSELMPSPWLAYEPYGATVPFVRPRGDPYGWKVSEVEEAIELGPGLAKIGAHVLAEIDRLRRREHCQFSRALLERNPAWPAALAEHAARDRRPPLVILPLALSRTQDDKGRVRWTLFGASHDGPERPFFQSFFDAPQSERSDAAGDFARLIAWATDSPRLAPDALGSSGVRVLLDPGDPDAPRRAPVEIPAIAKELLLSGTEPIDRVRVLVTFCPFERLPEAIRRGYLSGVLRLIPSPESLIFFEHRGYRKLSETLPWATQVALLHLFPRSESHYGLRIPQSGWLDEIPDQIQRAARPADQGHKIVHRFRRTHRWQRVERDEDDVADSILDDPVTVALFSTKPDDLGLYGKPMARNAQIWTERYERLLDGPSAMPAELRAAANAMSAGGRFGYRFFYPPMRAGERHVFWHRPLFAKLSRAPGEPPSIFDTPLTGFFTAERDSKPAIALWPRVLEREHQAASIELFARAPIPSSKRTAVNIRNLLEWADLLGELSPSLARHLLARSKENKLDPWLESLEGRCADRERGRALIDALKARIGPEPDLEDAEPLTFSTTRRRAFEERYWKMIARLAAGRFQDKNTADVVLTNRGKTGGRHAKTLNRPPATQHQLDPLAAYLHRYYRDLIDRHDMKGRAVWGDHRLRWQTDFALSWSEAWLKNAKGDHTEQNVVVVIPGRNRREALIMGDHYDTAYMEDVYERARGGDGLRSAASGADDNHSATAALMLAADVLLPLSREGRLARDVWLVHLTGEEFPSDCLGARALVSALIARDLVLDGPGGKRIDLSKAEVRGAFIMDMIAHNNDRHRDIFQISPGRGADSARLARRMLEVSLMWKRATQVWNASPGRKGKGPGRRAAPGVMDPPPIAEHLAPFGEVRPKWDPRSSLYNTDGQILSDFGVPVVLVMENYDITRAGYHDLHDTLDNIDLDYGAALTAIVIETVAQLAVADEME